MSLAPGVRLGRSKSLRFLALAGEFHKARDTTLDHTAMSIDKLKTLFGLDGQTDSPAPYNFQPSLNAALFFSSSLILTCCCAVRIRYINYRIVREQSWPTRGSAPAGPWTENEDVSAMRDVEGQSHDDRPKIPQARFVLMGKIPWKA
jgi:hypothetical protein